jgi:hypothetical protein
MAMLAVARSGERLVIFKPSKLLKTIFSSEMTRTPSMKSGSSVWAAAGEVIQVVVFFG